MTASALLDASPITYRRWLGNGLAYERSHACLNQRDAAQRLDVQRATIGHYETGRNLPSVGDLEALLTLYGAAGRIEHYRALREGARRGENWWRRIADVSPWFDHYLGLESGAVAIGSFDPMYLPGLLQTQRYAKAMFRADPDITDERAHELARVRTERRQILERADRPARLRAIVDESVLYRDPDPGDRALMREQLESLLADTEDPNIELSILPLRGGAFAGMIDHPFKVLDFPPEMVGDHGVVYIELHGSAQYLEEEGSLELYEQGLRDLGNAAAAACERLGAQPRELITKALKEVT
ncbi:helix-turn-helix domain-containing protein [Saccharopolyspora griseoalba]|uniref:Scr1 family TA system antitoxin-like transcriptional regulator n=1 Tax=Saccharopolyspora griseoalba TaxID=1431848 RepID=A0ABW2LPV4_9PSEU